MTVKVLNWALFVFLVLLYTILYIISWITIDDKVNKEEKGTGLAFFLCGLIATFIFVPAINIFSNNVAVLLWKILDVIVLLSSILVLVFNDRLQKQKSYKWSLIPILCITLVPFIFNVTIDFTNLENIDFNNHYSVESLGVFSAIVALLSTIVLIVFIAFTSKTRRKISELNHALLYYQHEFNNLSSFQKPYEKSLREDLYALIGHLEQRISNLVNIKESKDKTDDANQITTNEIHVINKKIDEIQKAMLFLWDKIYDKRTVDFDIIRDLNHFFATPFATIEANIELLKNTKGINTAHLDKINNSIQLCKCIVETYRESLSFSDSHNNIIDSLKRTIECAYNVYTERNGKTLESLNTDNIPCKFLSHNNHYIISIILPLLENAIQAAPNNTRIDIVFNNAERTICISNTCENTPSLKDLKTQGYSSKENHKGTGIMIVNNLLSIKNKGVLATTIEKNTVFQTIKLNSNE